MVDVENIESINIGEDIGQEELESSTLLRLIKELPPAYKMVFNLYVFEEYKHSEIADILGISVGTSKSNLSKAKAKLKKLIISHRAKNKKKDKAHG